MGGPLRPSLGDRLAPGVIAHTVRAVGMQVAEQGTFPAAEAVVSHRHRQRDVDADHADFYFVAKQPRGLAIAGEDAGAVAVFVFVDQLHGLFEAGDADDAEHRPENLLAIDAHVRGYPVKQAPAQKETVFLTGKVQVAAIHHQLRPCAQHKLFRFGTSGLKQGPHKTW